MPVSGNYGTPTNPNGDIYSSYWEIQWYSGSDPAHVEGDFWGRSDLTSGDKIATLRFDNGTSVVDIPVFPDATDPESSDIKKVARVPTGSGKGWMPILEGGGAYDYLGYQHGGVRHGVHDKLYELPDSAIWQVDARQLTGYNDGDTVSTWPDEVGSADATGTGVYRPSAVNGNPAVQLDGTNDKFDAASGTLNDLWVVFVVAEALVDKLHQPWSNDGANSDPSVYSSDNSMQWGMFTEGENPDIPHSTVGPTTPVVVTAVGDPDNTDNEFSFRVNGNEVTASLSGNTFQGLSDITIGERDGARFWDGYVGLVEIHDQLPNGGLAAREQELADSWGITV